MKQSIIHVALVVRETDQAIEFDRLGSCVSRWSRTTTKPCEQDKRWVLGPPGIDRYCIVSPRLTPEQENFIGRQTGGRVFLFLPAPTTSAR